jgi:hypothetical protein
MEALMGDGGSSGGFKVFAPDFMCGSDNPNGLKLLSIAATKTNKGSFNPVYDVKIFRGKDHPWIIAKDVAYSPKNIESTIKDWLNQILPNNNIVVKAQYAEDAGRLGNFIYAGCSFFDDYISKGFSGFRWYHRHFRMFQKYSLNKNFKKFSMISIDPNTMSDLESKVIKEKIANYNPPTPFYVLLKQRVLLSFGIA